MKPLAAKPFSRVVAVRGGKGLLMADGCIFAVLFLQSYEEMVFCERFLPKGGSQYCSSLRKESLRYPNSFSLRMSCWLRVPRRP